MNLSSPTPNRRLNLRINWRGNNEQFQALFLGLRNPEIVRREVRAGAKLRSPEFIEFYEEAI